MKSSLKFLLGIQIAIVVFIVNSASAQSGISISFDTAKCTESAFTFSVSGSAVKNFSVLSGSSPSLTNPKPIYTLTNFDAVWSNPAHIKTVRDSLGNWYSFVTNYTGSMARYSYGKSIYNRPTTKNFGNLSGKLGSGASGCDIAYENGNWYVFLTSGSNLVRCDFGNSLGNNLSSSTTLSTSSNITNANQVNIYKIGSEWIGFVVNYSGSYQLTRVDFGSSLTNSPSFTKLAFGSTAISDIELVLDRKTSKYFMFYTGQTSMTLTRVNFGTNLKNNSPTYKSLGNPNSMYTSVARGLLFVKDCDEMHLFSTDENSRLIRFDFPLGIDSTPSGTNLGSYSGTLKKSSFCSDPFIFDDSLCFHAINVGSDEYVQFSFPLAASKVIASNNADFGITSVKNTYSNPGTVAIRISVNIGKADQYDTCVNITVNNCSTGVHNTRLEGFNIGPNPVADNLIITVPAHKESGETDFIALYSSTGQLVLQQKLHFSSNSISVQGLAPGVYYAKINTNTNLLKIIKL